jgi:hypothetical protein
MSKAICSTIVPPASWGQIRHTHPAVVQAIFALSNEERPPALIWEAPTAAEWQEVAELVAEYVSDGDFTLDSGRFAWGALGTLRL